MNKDVIIACDFNSKEQLFSFLDKFELAEIKLTKENVKKILLIKYYILQNIKVIS